MNGAVISPWLAVRHVSVQFPGVLACDNVDLELRQGEIVGLAGKNGAGKSTLVKVLAGVNRPSEGEILLDGTATVIGSTHHANELGLSFVHQDLPDMPDLSVAEILGLGLGYPRRLGGLIDWRALHQQAARTLGEMGAAGVAPTALMGSLSVAEQRLVMIARALAQNARLVVLDEPTASLTDIEVTRLHDVMRNLRDRGVCVVFVTHRLDEMLDLSDRIVVMRDGVVVADQPRHTLGKHDVVQLIAGHQLNASAADCRRVVGAGKAKLGGPVLRTESLTREPRVHDIDLTVHEGEILGVGGLCGSGRTELLRLLFGADRPTSGTILLRGKPVRLASPRAARQAGIALLPEDRRAAGTVQDESIRSNITLASLGRYRRARWLPTPDVRTERASARRLMSTLGIRAHGDQQTVRTLSGGNQQKVVLAKWLDRGASLYLFDEPTHGVDIAAKEEIYQQMEQLAANGAAVLLVASDFSELVGVCHRVIVMREGRLVAEFSGDDVTEQQILNYCYTHQATVRSRS